MNNPIRWFEIYVENMARARKFYEGVLQIKLTKMEVPTPEGHSEMEMWGFPSNPEEWGCSGSLVKLEGAGPTKGGPGTIVYFASEDCSIEEARIKTFGGEVWRSKTSIGPYGFISLCVDSEGNMIGIHSMN